MEATLRSNWAPEAGDPNEHLNPMYDESGRGSGGSAPGSIGSERLRILLGEMAPVSVSRLSDRSSPDSLPHRHTQARFSPQQRGGYLNNEQLTDARRIRISVQGQQPVSVKDGDSGQLHTVPESSITMAQHG